MGISGISSSVYFILDVLPSTLWVPCNIQWLYILFIQLNEVALGVQGTPLSTCSYLLCLLIIPPPLSIQHVN